MPGPFGSPPDQTPRTTWQALARSFRHRDDRLSFTGQFLSLVGTWIQQVAQSWLVYRLTGSILSLGLVDFAGQFPVFALSPFFWLSALLLVPVGICLIVSMAPANTILRMLCPDNLRGRVMALYSMMFMGMAPFGALLAGLLPKPWEPRTPWCPAERPASLGWGLLAAGS
jgi:hypothetical protein